MTQKKMFVGRVKNCKPYPEGRTSLLICVDQINDDKIPPYHVNLCIATSDVNREDIKYASVVGFEAVDFQKWRFGQDRFLGTRMVDDRDNPKYRLPKLVSDGDHRLGALETWADVDYLARAGVSENTHLAMDVTPIYSLIGFNPESVALHENYKPETPIRVQAESKANKVYDHAKAQADKVDAQVV